MPWTGSSVTTTTLLFEGTLPAAHTAVGAYRAAELKKDLDTLTEAFTEVWLEANPKMAWKVGNA